jgi:hypothetical protein
MRGRGAWTFRSGNLVYHSGDALWICEKGRFKTLATGVHENMLYPRLSALSEPWTESITPDENPARKLLETFRKWNWTRPDVDPVLLLGWIGCALIGGALDWRPAVLLIGDRATGKSTLQQALRNIFGDTLFRSADTTAAGIYQAMAHDARPVALDELEPDSDPRKLDNVVHLMRTSASGDIGRRGGPTKGEASEFQMRSAFLFSAINNPLRSAQDMSRVAVLRLMPLNLNQQRPDPIDTDVTGAMMLSLMMQGWGDNGGAVSRDAGALQEGAGAGRPWRPRPGHLWRAAGLRGHAARRRARRRARRAAGPGRGARMVDAAGGRKPAGGGGRQAELSAMRRPDPDRHREGWRNSSRNTIGQTIEELRTTDDAGNAVEAPLDRGTAKRDLNMAGFGLFNTHEIVAGVMRQEKIGWPSPRPLRPAAIRLGAGGAEQVDQGGRAPDRQRLAARRMERRAAAVPGRGRDDHQCRHQQPDGSTAP